MGYRAPDPTPEMIEQAKLHHYDPNNTLGSLPIWDLRPDDTLAAAGLLHDLSYQEGGDEEQYTLYDENFERDCDILAAACHTYAERSFEYAKAELFAEIVYLLGSEYQHAENWNSDIVQAQADAMKIEAKLWINECARRIGVEIPYPEVEP